MQQDLLTVEQAAKYLHVAEDTVRIYIREKKLPAYRVGRSYLIEKSSIEKFLRDRKTTEDS